MLRGMVDLSRTLSWLLFGLSVMAAWPILPRRWIDLDAPWWRRYDHSGRQ